MRIIGDAEWKSVGANHYSCIVKRIIVGYFRSFNNDKWKVYQIVDDKREVVAEYFDENAAKAHAKIVAADLTK